MKVVILGAGPAGCSAAYFLRQKGITDITLIEQDAHVGGCSRTRLYETIPYEFGPQIMFTDREDLKAIFLKFLKCYTPPSPDKKYHYLTSVDGKLDPVYDFPISASTVLKLPQAKDIIWELYNLNLQQPDFENFEKYAISRVGPTLYNLFMKNYNKKAWLMDPVDMDTDWVQFRPIKLSAKSSRFDNQWQGHPGDYNPMWDSMAAGTTIQRGRVSIDGNFDCFVGDTKIDADLIVSTIPLSDDLSFVDTFMAFVALETDQVVLPAAFVTFPNNYEFVRAFEYKQQFMVESDSTLLSFDIPFRDTPDIDRYMGSVRQFCRENFKGLEIKEMWFEIRKRVYPISTRENARLFDYALDRIASKNIVPIGRGGMHAYCSKDTVIRMGMELAEFLPELLQPQTKKARILKMREDLH